MNTARVKLYLAMHKETGLDASVALSKFINTKPVIYTEEVERLLQENKLFNALAVSFREQKEYRKALELWAKYVVITHNIALD